MRMLLKRTVVGCVLGIGALLAAAPELWAACNLPDGSILNLDLEFNSLPEEANPTPNEMNPGGFICLGDPDLKRVKLSMTASPVPMVGTVILTIPGELRAWDTATRNNLVTGPWDLAVPSERIAFQTLLTGGIWVEGVATGTSDLKLSYMLNYAFPCEDRIRMTVLKVELDELTFSGNTAFKADDGSTVATGNQKWTPAAKTSALFTQKNQKAKINTKLRITPPLSSAMSMTIEGTADNGVTFTKAFSFPASTTTYTVDDIDASVTYGDEFDLIKSIEWRATFAGCVQDLGGSDNNIYYVPNGIEAGWHYDTILYNVCGPMAGSAPADDDATLNTIWGEFTGLQVYKYDRTTCMRYWAAASDGTRDTATALIAGNGAGGFSGNCEGWSRFLQACLELSGKSTSGSLVTLVNADRSWFAMPPFDDCVNVKNVNVNPTGVNYGKGDYEWILGPPANPGRWALSGSMAGQGSPAVPVEQWWPCHIVLKLGGKYYDPSYGKKAESCKALEDMILGGVEKDCGDVWWYFKPNTAADAELKEW